MADELQNMGIEINNEPTKLFKRLDNICELSKYSGYRIFWLEPSDNNKIGSLFAFFENDSKEKINDDISLEMIVRQNINSEIYFNAKDEALSNLGQFKILIDDVKETKAPVFMPLLPNEKKTGMDIQNLSPEIFENDEYFFSKIHKDIENSFDLARLQINLLTGKDVPEKWFLYGRDNTCTGLFRLWALCPEKTSAICCDKDIDNIVLPVMSHRNENMAYPFGFEDYEKITGVPGNDPDLLNEYRNTDVLYIGKTFDLGKQKHEEQVKSRLKKLKFSHINIERYDGTRIVDFAYFYQFRSEIYKESLLGRLFKKIIRKKDEVLMLAPAKTEEVKTEKNMKFGQLTEEEMREYQKNLNSYNRKPSRNVAKDRLKKVMTNNVIMEK